MKQLTLLFALLTIACSKPLDPNVQKLGSSEVTASWVQTMSCLWPPAVRMIGEL